MNFNIDLHIAKVEVLNMFTREYLLCCYFHRKLNQRSNFTEQREICINISHPPEGVTKSGPHTCYGSPLKISEEHVNLFKSGKYCINTHFTLNSQRKWDGWALKPA